MPENVKQYLTLLKKKESLPNHHQVILLEEILHNGKFLMPICKILIKKKPKNKERKKKHKIWELRKKKNLHFILHLSKDV